MSVFPAPSLDGEANLEPSNCRDWLASHVAGLQDSRLLLARFRTLVYSLSWDFSWEENCSYEISEP